MKWILEYTGGHTYPFLRLSEYLFSNLGLVQTDTDIQNLVVGENFNKSDCYRDISLRCFGRTFSSCKCNGENIE